jgi:molecular chaperone Hsp33
MNDKDLLQRFIFEKSPVRGELVHLNQSLATILGQHDYPPHIQKYLSQALVAAALLVATIKFHGRLTVQFRGKGKLKMLLAQCNQDFHLRGLAEWDPNLTADELPAAFEQGVLAIMMDPAIEGGRRYQGIVEWKGKSLIESIENYFQQSEQLPTRIWMAVDETSAAGLLLQVMPKEAPEIYDHDWQHLTILANTITEPELLILNNDTILKRLFSTEDIRIFDPMPVIFRCHCSVERSENAISLLSQEEIEDELKNHKNITVTCEFCNQEYVFDRVDIAKIFQKGNKSPGSTELQ